MKAPLRHVHRSPAQTKKRVQSYSTFIYKVHKQVCPAAMRSTDLLVSLQLVLPRLVLFRLVSSEASRLSKNNRLKAVTLQEIDAAVTIVQKRLSSKAAA
ncbi:Histone H2B [Oryzias melastigma]|uniref:Histone H2B n=1 Tax=Oryzias melastigma TaxID=30732 RepID=A0A834CU65_ORYME|nr:histone H2B-like [Oryzias melastigma]KAF6732701.1 Histone H2B [Oryzias melastigma]